MKPCESCGKEVEERAAVVSKSGIGLSVCKVCEEALKKLGWTKI